jgi:Carboxypeptidase regulatory-like domain
MSSKRVALLLVALFCLFAVTPSALYSQSATTGAVTGVVTDPTGAVVPGATITLIAKSTNSSLVTTTDSSGRYLFSAVNPGDYDVTAVSKGFRKAVIGDLKVEVNESFTVNIPLEIGTAAETVQVEAKPEVQLQTTDASIGDVLGGEAMLRLPAYTRSATSLMFLQPVMSPGLVGNDIMGGAMAGARSEQVTFNLDGGDVTSDLEGSNSYVSPNGEPLPAPSVPIPAESTEEFRLSTSNPNSTFSRSSGAQVAMITKHGTNSFHGSAYEYHSDDGLDANSWTNDTFQINKPHQVDNRFGATAGGPIWKEKVYFFTNYEGRRLYDSSSETRVVPTATLKEGIITLPNAAGTSVQYNFNPANGPITTACPVTTTNTTGTCDPRNIGVSPASLAQLALYPTGNNSSYGDGLNDTGYTFNLATPFTEDIAVTRLDYVINSKWSFYGTWHWARATLVSDSQVQIAPGTPKSVSSNPFQPNVYTYQLTGQLSTNVTSVFHGSWERNWWGWNRAIPTSFVPSESDDALQMGGEGVGNATSNSKLIADPININTQQARARIWNGHDNYIAEDMIYSHGRHTFQYGASGTIYHDYHLRTDDVLGGLTSGPIYYISSLHQSSGSYFDVGSAYTPGAVQANNLTAYDGLYAMLMGIVDHSSQIETRNGNFDANSLGTPLFDNVTIPAFNTYFNDVWKARPNLTVTLGIDWGVQLAPSERNGKEVVLTYADTGVPINYYQYLQNRNTALAVNGIYTDPTTNQLVGGFNPDWGLVPVNHLATPFTGQMRQTDWGDIGPRVAVAWVVPFKNKVFGDKATVIRGGYGLLYDRTSAVNEALSPLLTGGLADVDKCGGPTFVAGSPGAAVCSNGQTDPTNAFRIGVDGTSLGCAGCTNGIPATFNAPIPYIPGGGLSNGGLFGLTLSAPLDPFIKPGYSHNIDFSIQRALPGKLFFEIGYVGRLSRNLTEGLQLNAPDYMMKDKLSGQTFAQAFDAVAQQLRTGVPIASLKDQPFFDDVIGTANCGAQGFVNCTQMVAAQDGTDLLNGDIGDFGIFELNFSTPQFIDNMQVLEFAGVSDKGFSNYNAMFVKLNKTMSNGLQFGSNWTWSHAIGNQGVNQQYLYSADSPYNLNLDKSSEPFDRRHVINAWWYYTLPFGNSGRYKTSNSFINRVIGGWYSSGIFTVASGLPVTIGADGDFGAFIFGDESVAVSSMNLNGLTGVHESAAAQGTTGVPNFFGNPTAVLNSLSRPLISEIGDIREDWLREPLSWNIDASVGKNIISTERYKLLFSCDALNLFNHVVFGVNSLDMNNPQAFGTMGQANTSRRLLLGLRFEF